MITLIIWGAAMLLALTSASVAAFLGYQSAGRQIKVDAMLAGKHFDYKDEAETPTSEVDLVKEGGQEDLVNAEEPDR